MTTIDRIRKKLQVRLTKLTRKSAGLDIGPVDGDDIDMAFANDSTGVQSVLAEHDAMEVAKINEALARIDTGSYGICVDCGKKISATRLRVMPIASHCIVCQRANENGNANQRAGRADWKRVTGADGDDGPDFSVSLAK
jgi:DnaK suppressor protein